MGLRKGLRSWRNRTSLQTQMSLFSAVVLLIICASLILYNYYSQKHANEQQVRVALERVLELEAEDINGYVTDLTDFSLVIVKPDRRVVYTGCQWMSLEESAALGGTVLEKVSLTATGRMELES